MIACGALAREIAALRRANGWDGLEVRCLPAELHNRPERIAPAVRAVISETRGQYTQTFVAYGDCGTGGELDRVRRCLRVGGFVNCTPDFTDMPQVVNGASDLMVEVFGDAGKHARAAVGTSSLPGGVAVEIEATFELS